MHSLLEQRKSELAELCRSYRVEQLDVFGSMARGEARAASDVDFVVRFSQPHDGGYADRYLNLAESLEKLLGRPVDLMTERALTNRILRESIAADRRTVYAA
jgi:predicted nucleotidyltransferase